MHISVVIPSRNEKYLYRTIKDILSKHKEDIEVIAVLDGYWPKEEEIIMDKRVIYVNKGKPQGMREAINSGVAIARGKYILKTDAHCMFADGFDTELLKNMKDNWVSVPRRYPLDPEKWEIESRKDDKYPIDYMYLTKDLHGEVWHDKNHDPKLKEKMIDDLMSSQGSCWFMTKDYFNFLELEDRENYGEFASEFQEIGFKCWLSGGRVIINKNTWYAHWHKTEGRGYNFASPAFDIAQAYVERWRNEKVWSKQILPFQSMIDRFMPIPTWI